MKYFLHDTSAFEDEKITELYMRYGYEGVGLFYTALEKIAKQEKPIKTSVLKKQLHVGKKLEKCWNFLEEIGLIYTKDGESFNEKILSNSETYQVKKEKNREKISQWREAQKDKKNVTGNETDTKPVSNPPKEKITKENKINILFESFWAVYDKKVGDKEKVGKLWAALGDEERSKAMEHAAQYKVAQPDKVYRKDPATYLRNKSFNDEIIKHGTANNWANTNTGNTSGKGGY